MHTIKINNKEFTFSGEKGDLYYENLPSFFESDSSLKLAAKKFLSNNSICIDVGANIGLTTILMATHCPSGHVYSFEPSPVNAKHLRDNIARNEINNVTILESAVGAKDGSVSFHLSHVGANSTVVREAGRHAESDTTVVPLKMLDTWLKGYEGPRISFMKIDVEGFELEVLSGGAGLISKYNPDIFMEFNSATIAFEARLNPLVFAERVWEIFNVSKYDKEGQHQLLPCPAQYTHDNMVKLGCIDDVVMKLKPDIPISRIKEINNFTK